MLTDAPPIDFHLAQALLAWHLELGADEPIGDVGVDRYALPVDAAKPAASVAAVAQPAAAPGPDPVALATSLAAGAQTLADLARLQAGYDHCLLKKGARNFVFSDGNPAARVMVIGEAPGREEDQAGRPFVGPAGQLLDRMFAAIGLARGAPEAEGALYITNVLPWRPPQNRDPEADEIAMMLPFLARHVDLVDPDLIVLMGNTPCAAALGQRGILRLRGTWAEAFGRPTLPMTHPAYLLRAPAAKREAWADLLTIKARLLART